MYTPSQTFQPYPYAGNYGQQYQALQPQNNGFSWVQGESGANSFIVNPGQTVWLMDTENNNVFYIKSRDMSGVLAPLRIFDFQERVSQNPGTVNQDYITREEFEKRLAEVSHAKQFVQSNKSKQSQ